LKYQFHSVKDPFALCYECIYNVLASSIHCMTQSDNCMMKHDLSERNMKKKDFQLVREEDKQKGKSVLSFEISQLISRKLQLIYTNETKKNSWKSFLPFLYGWNLRFLLLLCQYEENLLQCCQNVAYFFHQYWDQMQTFFSQYLFEGIRILIYFVIGLSCVCVCVLLQNSYRWVENIS